MKHLTKLIYGCCLAAVPALVAAQGTGSMSNTNAMNGKDMAKEITVTGCMAQSADKKMFTLTNAMMASDMKGGIGGDMKMAGDAKMASGSSMNNDVAMKSDMKPMTYMLMGTRLDAHVGHKIEATGTVAADMKPAAGQSMGMRNGMDKEMAKMQTLNVKSIKMLAATCK